MAIEFYNITDKIFKESLFTLTEEDFKTIEIILVEFKKLTGLTIDEYGTTRLHHDHIKLIIKLIEDHFKKNTKIDPCLSEKLLEIKNNFSKIKNDVIAVGD